MITEQKRASISSPKNFRPDRSQAINVDPDPAKKSPTFQEAFELFKIASSAKTTGFCVGCT